ncbi:SDR family NAD(P)-dependent oxidoreductase [Spirosoma oryzicola]|uniref:SDR family NAD(P)-dependent oxidoreductase n=1 Tax=Spirosoma oryzicola TaxID=2898794 RepID=UPI001E34F0B0|nr:SDR family NAD(P)-dependent oxidoreductase [Spirosoma oryzicola]UHG94722.1 SDR family oxidoreductase [Spirosoma oryzicola]
MKGLQSKRILVAGSATGIGAATAKRLGEEGVRLVLGDINLEGVNSVAEEINANGGKAIAIKFDLADPDSITALIDFTVEQLGGLDGIANVAADLSNETIGQDLDLLQMQLPIWDKTLKSNLVGFALIIKQSLPHLIAAGGGSIVNTTSAASWVGEKIRPAYAASKAGVNTLTRHVAATWGKDNVRCNAVSPGAVLSETALRQMSPEFQQAMKDAISLTRLGKPDDLGNTIAFLLSDDAQWVTGQVWSVNGGGGFRD